MGKYTKLLWDVDETLLDFTAAENNGVQAVLRAYGVEPDAEKIACYSRINDSLWKACERGEITRDHILESRFPLFFKELGVEGDGLAAERLYRKQLDESAVLIDGALEILERLSGHYEMYVITNGVSKTQYSRLKKSGIDQYMKDIFVSEDAGAQKPQNAFFDYCLERMGHPALEQLLVIGDSLTSDIQGGINAGIDTCWFDRKGTGDTQGREVTYIIRALKELEEIL